MHESVLDHAVLKLVHPFSHEHDQLCQSIETGQKYVAPYRAKVQDLWNTHVHSHHLLKQYKVDSKLDAAKAHYFKYVYPIVLKFWSLVELAEYHIAVQGQALYRFLESHFHKTVVPKVTELKGSVAAQAETVKQQVKEEIKSKLD